MKKHKNKMLAPVLATLVVVAYYAIYFAIVIRYVPGGFKYLFGILPPVLCIFMVKACVERIKEIKRGEEDDLGKY